MIKQLLFVLGLSWGLLSSLGAQSSIYDLDHIVEVKIQFSETDWHEQLDSLKERGQDERLIADVTVDGKSYPEAGIRYKGNSSYFNVRNDGIRKLPFNIKVDYERKDARLPGGYVTLKLSNVFRDPSYLREVLGYDIARKYMPAPRANYARVYVNDDYLGLYNLTESVDDDFLKDFYGGDDGVFFKCDPNWHQQSPNNCKRSNNASLEYLGPDSVCYFNVYEIKSKRGWSELIALTEVLNKYPDRLENIMDINEALWMLAYNNVLVNLDSYFGQLGHNYYLYQDEQQVWHPILWDMNLCFGGFRYLAPGQALSNEKMQELSLFALYKEDYAARPLINQLLKNDHYRKIYLAHVRTIVEENFSNGWYKERMEEIRGMIAEEVAADDNRLYPLETFNTNVDESVRIENFSIVGLTELMDKRAEHILSHPLMQKGQPKISAVTHEVQGDEAMVSCQLSEAEAAFVYHRPSRFAQWQRVAMESTEDQSWGAAIPLGDQTQYYIVAENKYIATLSPARAGKEVYDVEVK